LRERWPNEVDEGGEISRKTDKTASRPTATTLS
jgi:hypothetical protein